MDNNSVTPIEEDVSVLTTLWTPSPEEASAIKSRITARKEKIGEIDEKIANLQARRQRLVKACDVGGAIMAPIRKLPKELLAEIFFKCIPSFPTKNSYPLKSSKRNRRRTLHGSYLHPQDVGEQLGKVCRAWETIVNAEPRIWSSIILDRQILDPEHIQRMLKKSKSHPLDILIQPYFWFSPDNQHVDNFNAIFSMIRSELWRIRTLMVDMHLYRGEWAMFPHNFSISAPMMQTFNYTCGFIGDYENDLGTFHGPQLCSLVIQNSERLARSFLGSPMQTVRHLEVKFTSEATDLYLQLLTFLPNLVSLYWNGTTAVEEIDGVHRTVILPSVKFLRLHTAGSAMDFLRSLRAPSLESFDLLANYQNGPMVSDVIDVLCGDGVVKLRRLHILHGTLPVPNIRTMLHQLNCLESLIIEASEILDDLFSTLSPQDQNFTSVCPQLTQLTIIDSEIPPGPFVDFVYRRTRADSDEAVPGYVTSLKLTKGVENSTHFKLCMHLAQTRSATIRFLSNEEYGSISLEHLDRRFANDWGDGGWGGGGGLGGGGGGVWEGGIEDGVDWNDGGDWTPP